MAETLGEYAEDWTKTHPRSERTNRGYEQKLGVVLRVRIDRKPLGRWEFSAVRPRHVTKLVDHMLRVEKRSQQGALAVLRVLAAMFEDAIHDEVAEFNPFRGVRVRASDPRIRKSSRVASVWTWEQMHGLAWVAGALRDPQAEAMVRVLSDCGLRLGELVALRRQDVTFGPCGGMLNNHPCSVIGPHLHVRRTADRGIIMQGTKTDHGVTGAGRAVPVGPGLEAVLRGLQEPRKELLFPAPQGGCWNAEKWRERVWAPACDELGLWATPHEFRHSFVSLMQASGVDPADLAAMTGHTVATMHARYTHSTGRSYDAVREAVGS